MNRLGRHREQILADCQAEIQKHEFQADYDRRSIQKLSGVIESQRGEINRAHQGDERLRRDQQLLHEQLLEQNRDLREAHVKSLNEMEELKRFQGSTFDEFSRRRLIEDRDTILELTAKIQELQNEVNCMNDSRDLKDAEAVRSGQSHVTSQPAFSHFFVNRTPSHVTFSRAYTHSFQCLTRHWLKVLVRVIPSMCHALVCLISLRPSLRTLHLSLPSSTSFDLSLHLLCGLVRS